MKVDEKINKAFIDFDQCAIFKTLVY